MSSVGPVELVILAVLVIAVVVAIVWFLGRNRSRPT